MVLHKDYKNDVKQFGMFIPYSRKVWWENVWRIYSFQASGGKSLANE